MAKEDNTNKVDDTQLEETIEAQTEEQAQEEQEEISELDQVKQDLEAEKDKFLRLFAVCLFNFGLGSVFRNA